MRKGVVAGWLLIINVAVGASVAGCGDETAMLAYYNFGTAMYRHDRPEAMKYCTAAYAEKRLESDFENYGLITGWTAVPCPPELLPTLEQYRNYYVIRRRGRVANVYYSAELKESMRYDGAIAKLVLTAGGWKVDVME